MVKLIIYTELLKKNNTFENFHNNINSGNRNFERDPSPIFIDNVKNYITVLN